MKFQYLDYKKKKHIVYANNQKNAIGKVKTFITGHETTIKQIKNKLRRLK